MTLILPRCVLLISIAAVSMAAACSDADDDTPVQLAPERAYIGMVLTGTNEGEVAVGELDEAGPAALANVQQADVIVSIDGEAVGSSEDMMRIVEAHMPGDVLIVELQRKDPPEAGFARIQVTMELTTQVTLGTMPLPDATNAWLHGTGLRWNDQLRLGMSLAEITPALAQHHGLESGGVLNVDVLPWQLKPLEPTLEDGDVLLRLNGKHIDSLVTLQSIVDGLDDASPLKARVLRDGVEQDIELQPLGPDMPGRNQLPSGARQRLTAAVERGALHPDRAAEALSFYRPTDPEPGVPTMRYGNVTAISGGSITIALFESGNAWTVPISERSQVYPEDLEVSDVKVSDFVAVIRRPEGSVRWIYVLSVPFPPAQ